MPRILSRDEVSLARSRLADALRDNDLTDAAAWQALLGERGPLSTSDELNEVFSRKWQSFDLLAIEAYLAAGADPGSARASSGTSVLLQAAHERNAPALKLFLPACEALGWRPRGGVTPLIAALSAAAEGSGALEQAIEAILPFADCNIQLSGGGHTPLGVAAIKGFLGSIALLAPHTDLSIVDSNGNSPLANLCACKRRGPRDLSLASALFIPELANKINRDGICPLEIAASNGHLDLATALLPITDLSSPRAVNGQASTLLAQATHFAQAAGRGDVSHAIAARAASVEAAELADSSPMPGPQPAKHARL